MHPVFLADYELGGTWSSTCEGLSSKFDLDEYFEVIRTLDLDHAFWRSLVINETDKRGVALVLETRLGALSGKLSPYFKTVISWHASARAAMGTQQYLDRNKIQNVRVVVADSPEKLVVGTERLAAIIFYGPSQDLTGQWGHDTEILLKTLIKQVPQWLADEGIAVVAENNKLSVRHRLLQLTGGFRPDGITLPGLGRHLKGLGDYDLYVGNSQMTSSHVLTQDLVRREHVAGPSLYRKNILSKLKDKIVNTRLARLLKPSFLFVVSRQPRRKAIQDVLERQDVCRLAGWSDHEKILVKRIIAGNLGTTIIVAGPVDHGRRDAVIRLPSRPSGNLSCRVNAQTLKMLASTPLSSLVPRFLGEGIAEGQEFTVESRCPGYEAGYRARSLDKMLQQACESVSVLHRLKSERVKVTDEVFHDSVAPLIQDLAEHCTQELRLRLDRFMDVLRHSMRGKTVAIGYTHGDFKLGNFLFDRSGNLTALIDWDGFSEDGFQIFDFLTLLAYKMAYDKGANVAEIYSQYLLPWKLPATYTHLAGDRITELMIDNESFLFARIVFWFSLNYTRFDELYKYHPMWQRQFLLPMLEEFEKIEKAGWRH